MTVTRACLLALLGLTAGCTGPTLLQQSWPASTPGSVELSSTPFYPQQDYQCGPAALATVLSASMQVHGRSVTPGPLVAEVYVPDRKGSLQPEIVAAARKRGLVVYPIRPTLGDLVAQLVAGQPVLVLQNLGLKSLPVWHYAVVVGADASAEELILRSGTVRRRVEQSDDFMRRWSLADRWGIVTLQPGILPADPDWPVYLRAVADLEASGASQAAGRAYEAALAHDPGLVAARFGLANARYAQGQLEQASALYLSLLGDSAFAVPALNNLANIYIDQACLGDAELALDRAQSLAGDGSGLRSALASTRERLLAAIAAAGSARPGLCVEQGP
ncbi:MAG: PA2778 family cysteine peptidase [Gammaproteobacteria bacterium]